MMDRFENMRNPNIINKIKVNGTQVLPVNKEIDLQIPVITASSVDLEDGVSELATGNIHLVYEDGG